MDDILLAKAAIIERCLHRVDAEYQKLDLAILQAVIEQGDDDFIAFCAALGLDML